MFKKTTRSFTSYNSTSQKLLPSKKFEIISPEIKMAGDMFNNAVSNYKKSTETFLSNIKQFCDKSDMYLNQKKPDITQARHYIKNATDLANLFLEENCYPPSALIKEQCNIIATAYAKYAAFIYKTEDSTYLDTVDTLINKALELEPDNALACEVKENREYSWKCEAKPPL